MTIQWGIDKLLFLGEPIEPVDLPVSSRYEMGMHLELESPMGNLTAPFLSNRAGISKYLYCLHNLLFPD